VIFLPSLPLLLLLLLLFASAGATTVIGGCSKSPELQAFFALFPCTSPLKKFFAENWSTLLTNEI